MEHFYPRSPCGERLYPSQCRTLARDFYPRSPCGERLRLRCYDHRQDVDFYPRSPCGERPPIMIREPATSRFLSTLSLRRATSLTVFGIRSGNNFYPRSPCGERHGNCPSGCRRPCISIHALLAESDPAGVLYCHLIPNFYPRSPCGERRVTVLGIQHRVGISIHALLAESDL